MTPATPTRIKSFWVRFYNSPTLDIEIASSGERHRASAALDMTASFVPEEMRENLVGQELEHGKRETHTTEQIGAILRQIEVGSSQQQTRKPPKQTYITRKYEGTEAGRRLVTVAGGQVLNDWHGETFKP